MSRRKRRKFTAEQKAQAVRLAQELGSIAQAARDLDLTESSLANWIKQAKIDEGCGQPGELTTDERAELHRLRRENRILEQERSFLKKAAAYFAEDTITERRSK
jgi:transposase